MTRHLVNAAALIGRAILPVLDHLFRVPAEIQSTASVYTAELAEELRAVTLNDWPAVFARKWAEGLTDEALHKWMGADR